MQSRIPLIAVSLIAACHAVHAGTEYGTVVSSRPVTAQVSVPRQQCTEQQAVVPPQPSGGGALLGALIGGAVGHGLGEGMGRVAATGLGVVAGSVLGDRVEAAHTPAATVPVRTCQTVNLVENRVVGYDVSYDYDGQRYTARLPQDPGDRIALNVAVSPQVAALTAAQPVLVQPTASVAAVSPVAVYPAGSPYPYYGPYAYGSYYGVVGPVVPRVAVVVGPGYRHHGF